MQQSLPVPPQVSSPSPPGPPLPPQILQKHEKNDHLGCTKAAYTEDRLKNFGLTLRRFRVRVPKDLILIAEYVVVYVKLVSNSALKLKVLQGNNRITLQ